MLFADIKGYGLLDDAGLRRFTEYYLPEIARTLEAFKPQILLQEMTGDGLFLVFSDITVAIKTAVELRRSVFQTSKRASGLPSLQIRISLDAGPVYTFNNPVTRHPAVCGTYVNRAARIEPITPPNEVYASETFAALYVASGATAFRFDYVGQTQLPKGFGYVPLYCVSENPERS
jgi:class 3 adenylate cyclase